MFWSMTRCSTLAGGDSPDLSYLADISFLKNHYIMAILNTQPPSSATDIMAILNTQPPSSATDPMLMTVWIALVVLLGISLLAYRSVTASKGSKLNLPPMPQGIPILGTMLQTRGPKTHQILIDISKKFGKIFALKTGLKYFIVVMSSDIAHEALMQNSQVFSSRPKFLSRLNFTGWRGVNSALYSPYWRDIRKNLVTHVTSTSRVAAFQPFREMELDKLIQRVRDQAKANDNVVPVLSNCRHTVFAILLHVCFGRTFESFFIQELDVVLRKLIVLLAPQVIDFIPLIRMFSKKHKNKAQEMLEHLRNLFSPLIEEHRHLRKNGNPAGDYVDSLIVLQQQIGLEETDILGLIGEVLAAGTDTTANSLEWTMANLIQHPAMKARIYAEIKSVVPDGQLVSEADVERMPYMHAVVKEALRKHPPLPFGIVHGVTQQTKLRGYDIPEDAMMLFHIQAMQNNPERWDHPEKFNPERFLSGASIDPDLDMTGSHGPRSLDFIPFGAGRRMCPGMNLALKHIHLILARLLQTFEWSNVEPGEEVDFSERLEFTVVMSNRLHARVTERSIH